MFFLPQQDEARLQDLPKGVYWRKAPIHVRQRAEYEIRETFYVLATSALQYLQDTSKQMFFTLKDTPSFVDLDCHMA